MKKEEFPTFLNEQPAVIFGRTGRELLIIAIGLILASLLWLRLGLFIQHNVVASNIAKGLIVVAILAGAGAVAFIKIATLPLEEWAFVWLFYVLVPKVYVYTTMEVDALPDKQSDAQEKSKNVKRDEDDDFEDD